MPWSRSRRRRRWLAGGAGAVLAAVLGVVLVAQSQPSVACAAPPVGDTTHRGKATFYTLTGGGGNCSYDGPPADGLFVALGPQQYADAAACGGHLDVTGPKGRVRVKILDRCPECPAGHIDLSAAAFRRIADPVRGVVPVTFRAAVDPPLPGPLTFRIKQGASRYWFAVRVDNTGNPLASVRAKTAGGGFRTLTRTDYNFWLFDSGLGPGPFTIEVTDVYGNTATASGISLHPEVTQTSEVRLYGAGIQAGATRPAKRSAKPTATTAPPTAAAVAAGSSAASPRATSEPAAITPSAALAAAADADDCAG